MNYLGVEILLAIALNSGPIECFEDVCILQNPSNQVELHRNTRINGVEYYQTTGIYVWGSPDYCKWGPATNEVIGCK